MRLRTQCPSCGLPFGARIEPGSDELPCPNCGATRSVTPIPADPNDRARVSTCMLCGCRHLYRQRDFNRAWGCVLVVVGAVLVPFTYGLSLVVFSLVDLWLYRRLSEVVVCYRCDTVYRDARPGPRQGDFDLLKHDVLKYGKSWDQKDGA